MGFVLATGNDLCTLKVLVMLASSKKGAQSESFQYRIRDINCKTAGEVFSPQHSHPSYGVLDPIKKEKKAIFLCLSMIN